MRVLVACEFSGTVRRAFRERGHEAWSCDLLPAEDGSPFHYQRDVLDVLRFQNEYGRWDLMIAHPPCTYLNRAGWHWVNKPDSATPPLKGAPRRAATVRAAEFFRRLWDAPVPRKAIENPVPIKHAGLPPYTQIVQPHMFGHPEFKATCLWLYGLPPLRPTEQVPVPAKGTEQFKTWSKVHRMPPGPDRWKERSRTYPGIAAAMASQWGVDLSN